MRYLPVLCTILMAGTIAACSSGPRLVETPAHPQISQRGSAVIAEPLDRALLSSLVIDYINLFRSRHNLSLLTYEEQASRAAFWMSDYQARAGEVSHVAKTNGFTRMGDRYRMVGGGTYACGYENAGWYPLFNNPIGRNYTYDEMARSIVDGWINSPEHLENLVVKAEGTGYIGLGVAKGSHTGLPGIYSTMNIFFYLPKWTDYSDVGKQTASTPGAVAGQSKTSAVKKTTTTSKTSTSAKKKTTTTKKSK